MVTALAGAVLVGAAGAAGAAQQPTGATISSVKVANGTLTGVLTIRAADMRTAVVEPRSVAASVGTAKVPVSIRPISQSKRSVMLVVDTSGSMGEAGMKTVREAVAAFLRDAPRDVSIGLVSFATTAGVDVPLTLDRARLQKAVNALQSRGETTLYDGVAAGAAALGRAGDRSMILLSDGGDTRSTKATQASATSALRTAGIRAEVVAFKTAESDTSVLRGFASAGGGSVAPAGNSAAVREAFSAAARALDSQVSFSLAVPAGLAAKQTVQVTGAASGRPFVAKTQVDLGAAVPVTPTATPEPTESSVLTPDGVQPRGTAAFAVPGIGRQLVFALVLTGIGLLGLAAALLSPVFRSRRKHRVETIESYLASGAAVVSQKKDAVSPSAISAGLVNLGDRVMDGRQSTTKTMRLIDRADLSLRPGEWWVLRLVALVAGVAIAMVFFRGGLGMTLFAVAIGAVSGYFLPSLVLRFLAKRRGNKFEAQLPDVLTLVASSLASGFSLLQALDAVAKDAAEPAAKEFSRALAETRIGADVPDALEKMASRMDSANMRWTTMAIRIQREVGGNLAETLRTTAKTLRQREELRRHVKALSAEGRLSAYILIGLPIGIFLYSVQVNREYIELLWTRPLGWAMLAGGIVSMIIGTAWMRKVVDVQV